VGGKTDGRRRKETSCFSNDGTLTALQRGRAGMHRAVSASRRRVTLGACLLAVLACVASAARAQADKPLPSWNDGPARNAITEFVAAVTTD